MWRSHLIVAVVLALLILPIYFLDQFLLKPKGGDWISLDFRGLFVVGYLIFLGLELILSSLGIYFFSKFNLGIIHTISTILAIILLFLGVKIFN